jgi:hypothetical protein
MGNNFKYIYQRYKIVRSSNFVKMKGCIMKYVNNSINEENVRIGKQIRQLIDIRDSVLFDEFNFTPTEIKDLIKYLSTM